MAVEVMNGRPVGDAVEGSAGWQQYHQCPGRAGPGPQPPRWGCLRRGAPAGPPRGRRALTSPLLEEGETWKECQLVQQVSGEVTKWIQTNRRIRKSSKKKMKQDEVVFQQLLPDQLVLLLEFLLEEKTLCPRILQCLERTYQLREQDAEVRHRWCELVIKHKYEPGYGDIERFLREDQAMGVYLYGELMVNEDAKQQELARKCFAAAQEHMDASSAKVVAEMLF